jgi:beta-glucosidase
VDVKNTGSRAGKEVIQVYLSFSDVRGEAKDVDFPIKVLRQFEKINLEKDELQRVNFNLTRRDLSYWDVVKQNWVMPTEGAITIQVGSSSRDLKLTGWY